MDEPGQTTSSACPPSFDLAAANGSPRFEPNRRSLVDCANLDLFPVYAGPGSRIKRQARRPSAPAVSDRSALSFQGLGLARSSFATASEAPFQMSRRDVQKESRPITIVLQRRAKACRQTRAGTPDRPYLGLPARFAKRILSSAGARRGTKGPAGQTARRGSRCRLWTTKPVSARPPQTGLGYRPSRRDTWSRRSRPC